MLFYFGTLDNTFSFYIDCSVDPVVVGKYCLAKMQLPGVTYHPSPMSMNPPCQWTPPLRKKKYGPFGQWIPPS